MKNLFIILLSLVTFNLANAEDQKYQYNEDGHTYDGMVFTFTQDISNDNARICATWTAEQVNNAQENGSLTDFDIAVMKMSLMRRMSEIFMVQQQENDMTIDADILGYMEGCYQSLLGL